MIGYYVHHRGEGHATRAASIAAHLGEGRVTGLSSRPRPDGWGGEWVQLARDDGPGRGDAEPTAGGVLHWAPLGHAGLRARMAQLAGWVQVAAPELVIVDVSVEVAVAVRTMGVPVVVMGMPGDRRDAAHQLAFRLAEAILAPWPAWADVLGGGAPWRAKTHAVGAISRFDDRSPAEALPAGDRRRVLVLSGRGGTGLSAGELFAAEHATPDWAWTVAGPPSDAWVADPWPLICGADVVVTHAGQNAIADVAAARRPAIVIPQDRPHAEQHAMAGALRDADLATVCPAWPAADRWPELLAAAARRDGDRWTRWSTRVGGARAAEALEALIAGTEALCAPR